MQKRDRKLTKQLCIRAAMLAMAVTTFGTAASEASSEVRYTYADPENVLYVGTKKQEVYDVAIRFDAPSLKGARIVGMEVPAAQSDCVSSYSGWLSTELKLENDPESGRKKNVADICSAPATVTDGMVTARFDEPYTLTGEPVYVGYTFSVDAVVAADDNDPAKYPIAVSKGVLADGLYVHTQRHYMQWKDRSAELLGTSQIRVLLEGDFPACEAALFGSGDVKVQGDDETVTLLLRYVSYGSEPISTLGFDYEFGGVKRSADYKYPAPVSPMFGQNNYISLTIPMEFEGGTGPFTISLSRINGVENASAGKTATFGMSVVRLLPQKRPLVEEYTGLWCGNCPRGYVAMEHMAERHSDFIGIAIHNGDDMAVIKDYPSAIGGFPNCVIDRGQGVFIPSVTTLASRWEAARREYSPVQLDVTAERGADNPNRIDIEATAQFVERPAHDCRMAYMLLANGLSDETWLQSNYLSNKPESYMDFFVNSPGYVSGLVFNDVLTMHSPFAGEEGSMPAAAEIPTYTPLTHTYSFDTTGHRSLSEYDLIGAAGDNLSVVAVLIDTTDGSVINAARYNLNGVNAVGSIGEETDATVVSEQWYDMQGRPVAVPVHGLYIRKTILSDGSQRSLKTVVR